MSNTIAIPSETPGGLDANLGAHFGHCDLYTLIRMEDDQVTEVKVLPNVPHQHGGCMAPVKHLADNGVTQLIAGGMGLRPLIGFHQVGIDVYFCDGTHTVSDAVQAMMDGRLSFVGKIHAAAGATVTDPISGRPVVYKLSQIFEMACIQMFKVISMNQAAGRLLVKALDRVLPRFSWVRKVGLKPLLRRLSIPIRPRFRVKQRMSTNTIPKTAFLPLQIFMRTMILLRTET